MTAPVSTALGASSLNRKWRFEVDTSATATPTWVVVQGLTEFTPNLDDATWQDDSDFDSAGAKSQTKTAFGWSLTATLRRGVTAASATAYDVGQEFLRLRAINKTGIGNSCKVRFYELEPGGPRVEAYSGRAGVQWAQQGGGMDALSTVSLTLQGQGGLTILTHPFQS